jgi:hypothetical protein
MKRILLLIVALLVLPFTAHAEEASKRAKIGTLLSIIRADRNAEEVISLSMQGAKQRVDAITLDRKLSASDQKAVDDCNKTVIALIHDLFDWDKTKPMYIDAYASTFSESEVDSFLAFF